MSNEFQAGASPTTALERMRIVSQALSDAARRTRVSSRSRNSHASGGFKARRGAALMRWAIVISFYLMVVLPSASAIVYYGFIASDQYVAVADFTVMGGEPIPIDGLQSLTGIPAIAIIQDTQIVTNYLGTRAAVERLQQAVDMRTAYSDPAIDRLSRLNPHKPIERFVSYWNRMMSASIKMPSGAVELRVRAFKPEDAARIAQAAVTICEQLINELNDRMLHDAVSTASQELDRSMDRLTQTQVALEQARNDEGILDAGKAADMLNKLMTEVRTSLLQLQGQYDTQLKFVSASAPQSRALKSRIDTTEAQLQDLQSKLTGPTSSDGQMTLAGSMSRFSELDLEHTVAQRLYGGAVAALEGARLASEHKMMYLNAFVKPVVPEQAEYPKRGLQIGLIVGGALALWGLCCVLALTIRNHMA